LEADAIGPHVTLYEFFHTRNNRYHGLLDDIVSGNKREDFLEPLRAALMDLGELHVIARQADVTKHSVRLLADVWKPGMTAIMDQIRRTCDAAAVKLASLVKPDGRRRPVPFPLHITIAQLPSNAQERVLLDRWSDEHKRVVWGTAPLSLVLTAAKRSPFNDVTWKKL
jgi:hypothetical protein